MVLVIGWPTTQGITYKNAVYKRVIQRLDQFDTNTVGVVNFRWIIRGTVYAWLENSEYEFIDLQNIKEEDLHPGTIIIYDPTYFTDIGERRENREEFPALAGLPERIPENWMLLFEDHHFLYDRQSVYVYAVSD